MCALKSPMSQVMSNYTFVKVFLGTKMLGGSATPNFCLGGYGSPLQQPPSSTTTCMYVMGGGFGHSNLPQGKGGMQQREALDFRSLDVDISAFVPDSHSHYASS